MQHLSNRTFRNSVIGGVLRAVVVSLLFVAPPTTADAQSLSADGRPVWNALQVMAEKPMAPEVAFRDAADQDRGFVEYRGKLVIAVFWATWCPICKGEMPKFDRLQAELGADGLRVVALSVDREGLPIVKRYYAKHGIRHLRVFHDTESILASVLGIRGVPTIFVIDPEGRMIGVVEGGANWESPEALAFLRSLLPGYNS